MLNRANSDVSAADGVKEGGVGRGAESARDVGGEGGVFKIGDGRDGRVDGEGSYRWVKGGGNVRGIRGGGCSRHTFSLARLEPTRPGVGSCGAKMDSVSVVGARRQEPEV